MKHKEHNKVMKRAKNSKSNILVSVNPLRNEVHRAAKTIKNMDVSQKTKTKALRRLFKLHRANRPVLRGDAQKVEQEIKKAPKKAK